MYFAIKVIVLREYILMFNLCVFIRALQMNIIMFTVLNANIPVIHIVVVVHIHVKCVVRYSVKRAIL